MKKQKNPGNNYPFIKKGHKFCSYGHWFVICFINSKRLLKTPAQKRRRPDLFCVCNWGLISQTLLNYRLIDQYARLVGVGPIT